MKKLTSTLRYHGSAEVSFRKRPQGFSGVWDADSLDGKDYDADTIYRRVTDQVAPGSIVLFHNAALHTPEALPRILDTLLGDGYSVIPISQLIYTGNYTIDHTGRQFPAEQPG